MGVMQLYFIIDKTPFSNYYYDDYTINLKITRYSIGLLSAISQEFFTQLTTTSTQILVFYP